MAWYCHRKEFPMLILLSSWHRPRYKEDILRCLAAPLGAEIQFRYDLKWVAHSILEKIRRGDNVGYDKALVCFLDHTQQGVQPLLPVRSVDIKKIREHGSTITVT